MRKMLMKDVLQTTRSTAISTSDSASASIPTIPPPLNLPPSRARRQLAARLALHSREAQSSSQESQDSDSSNGHESGHEGGLDIDSADTRASVADHSQQRRTLGDPFEPTITSATGTKSSLSPRSPTFRTGLGTSSGEDEDTDEDDLNTTIHLSPEPTSSIFIHRPKDSTSLSPSSPPDSNQKNNNHLLGFDRLGESNRRAQEELENFANSPAADAGDEEEQADEGEVEDLR